MKTLDKKEIQHLLDLVQWATPGPWKNDCGNGQVEHDDTRITICNRMGNYERRIEYLDMHALPWGAPIDDEEVEKLLTYNNDDDMDFIAAARDYLPRLLVEVIAWRERYQREINNE